MRGKVRLLFAKEMTGAFRDRRTMFLTVLFPLIFYPMVFAVMGRFSAAEQISYDDFTPAVFVVDQAVEPRLSAHLAEETAVYWMFADSVDDGLARMEAGDGQAVLRIEDAPSGGGPGLGLVATLYFDHSDQVASLAAGKVRETLGAYLEGVVRENLETLGMDYDDLTAPMTLVTEDVAGENWIGQMLLSRLLPYFMVLAILTGSMGLGGEITAGEKERGTIATLLVSQLSRTDIVLGKFLAVMTISLISALLSAVGLLIGLRFFGGDLISIATGGDAAFIIGWSTLGWMLAVLVPLAIILAALVIIVGSFARSQKEASTYLMPIYMVIVLIGLVTITGTSGFAEGRFFVPIANALYALQEILSGTLTAQHVFVTLAANSVVGGILIALAVRLFKRESVLFRS